MKVEFNNAEPIPTKWKFPCIITDGNTYALAVNEICGYVLGDTFICDDQKDLKWEEVGYRPLAPGESITITQE